ncbi:MAG: hypothetical protein JNK76_07400 [Planctomycetales bacterium]|nr:hypothetical protein [Planctomycetales bacterium]MBN8624674.1 hypothetical protein [Planctomycetota bacterium]
MSLEIALIVFLGTNIAGRILSERAMKNLSVEQKASLVDAFRGQRAYGLLPIFVLLAVNFLMLRYTSVSRSLISAVYWAGLLVYLAGTFWFTRTRLAALHLPQTYLTQFGIARAIQYVGIGVLLAVVIAEGV